LLGRADSFFFPFRSFPENRYASPPNHDSDRWNKIGSLISPCLLLFFSRLLSTLFPVPPLCRPASAFFPSVRPPLVGTPLRARCLHLFLDTPLPNFFSAVPHRIIYFSFCEKDTRRFPLDLLSTAPQLVTLDRGTEYISSSLNSLISPLLLSHERSGFCVTSARFFLIGGMVLFCAAVHGFFLLAPANFQFFLIYR